MFKMKFGELVKAVFGIWFLNKMLGWALRPFKTILKKD